MTTNWQRNLATYHQFFFEFPFNNALDVTRTRTNDKKKKERRCVITRRDDDNVEDKTSLILTKTSVFRWYLSVPAAIAHSPIVSWDFKPLAPLRNGTCDFTGYYCKQYRWLRLFLAGYTIEIANTLASPALLCPVLYGSRHNSKEKSILWPRIPRV